MTTTPNHISFTSWINKVDYQYKHGTIQVFKNDARQHSYGNNYITLTWQTDREKSEWYAFRCKIEVENIEDLPDLTRLAKRVIPTEPGSFYITPAIILARLHALKAIELVHDERLSEYVSIYDVLPEDYHYFLDDNEPSYSHFGVMARTESEAKALLTKKFVEQNHLDPLADWIKKGQPVRHSYHFDKVPSTLPAEYQFNHELFNQPVPVVEQPVEAPKLTEDEIIQVAANFVETQK